MDEVLPNGKFDIPGDADLDEYDLGDEDMPLDQGGSYQEERVSEVEPVQD